MREYDFLELLHCHTLLDGDAGALDDFGRRIAEHVDSQDPVASGIGDYLAQALSPFILGHETAGLRPGEFQNLYIHTLAGGLIFSKAYP